MTAKDDLKATLKEKMLLDDAQLASAVSGVDRLSESRAEQLNNTLTNALNELPEVLDELNAALDEEEAAEFIRLDSHLGTSADEQSGLRWLEQQVAAAMKTVAKSDAERRDFIRRHAARFMVRFAESGFMVDKDLNVSYKTSHNKAAATQAWQLAELLWETKPDNC